MSMTEQQAALVAQDPHVAKAKSLLREHLRTHPDPAVRLLNTLVGPADDDPAVVRVAAALRARALSGSAGEA